MTVVGAGITVHEALAAADILGKEGIAIRVIDAYSVKPIDRDGLLAGGECDRRPHDRCRRPLRGGRTGRRRLNAVGNKAAVVKLAVREIPRSGPPEALIDKYGISRTHIADAVRQFK